MAARRVRRVLRARPSAAERNARTRASRTAPARAPACGYTSLSSFPRSTTSSAARLRAHADPIEAAHDRLRTVRLDRDCEAARVQRSDGVLVELQQRLAASAYDQTVRVSAEPCALDAVGEIVGRGEASAVFADADEIGIAEAADRACAVALASVPEIAAGEPAEDRGAPRVRALTLKRVKDLLHRVGHANESRKVTDPRNPLRRSRAI